MYFSTDNIQTTDAWSQTNSPFKRNVDEAWQHKVLQVYEEVLCQHPQGEEKVDGSKEIEDNYEPTLHHW